MSRLCLAVGTLLVMATPVLASAPPRPWWSPAVESALEKAGGNRAQLTKALVDVPKSQRKGMAFLIEHMPSSDRRTLRADFLLENVALSYEALAKAPWRKSIPEDVFLDEILPYANLDEERHPWRKSLREQCLPIVQDCKTSSEAAIKLNATLFGKLKVKYSTARKKPNQSPKESIEQGLASCSGLSILLVDACRSVGVPARVVGTPLWADKRGNHTWVEIWDGRWHFTGACEQDPKGLDRGWFVHPASQAIEASPVHAIYAASFRKTAVAFPLVWDRRNREVPAENVTSRYVQKKAETKTVRVQIRVRKAGTKERIAVAVVVEEKGKKEEARGTSKGESADTNDFLTFELQPGRSYVVRVGKVEKTFEPKAGEPALIDIEAE